ncbi:Aste57867_18024 [Aphanomyces stellatus]|uniref:Aste57867_18024 protein n=1 Tax=Aphanomyces stellatus TaxID=120398 RepID=A0A485LAQ3_9STRA|nr:hypothetical protein As57867_017962 [Aphanomyces stellatus]VFT94763.1 Aste57867_18024 [Aphanomyces stellatus]
MVKGANSLPARAAETSALQLTSVKFASQPASDTFRVQLRTTTAGDVPVKLWLENKRTKHQWECTVEDVKAHAPKDANYVLPAAVVLAGLKAALLAKDGEGKTPCNDCDVDLEGTSTDAMVVVLTMKAFGGLTASYSFGLTPLAVAKTDVLEAKIRDLEEEVAALKAARSTPGDNAQLWVELKELRTNMRSRGYYSGTYY